MATFGTDAQAPAGSADAGPPEMPDRPIRSAATTAEHSDATSPAERLACTNGTSDAILACGFNPGPTAVAFEPRTSDGSAVRVRAVELDAGGFVAIHRISYIDGEFTDSVVGVSEYLSPGLHRGVNVTLDEPVRDGATLVAVTYRDTDGDTAYDFAATDGADDRPYTNTYSNETGNVTDEAGDVIGDAAAVEVVVTARYENDAGAVDTDGLRTAVGDWATGDLTTEQLIEVVVAWSRGG